MRFWDWVPSSRWYAASSARAFTCRTHAHTHIMRTHAEYALIPYRRLICSGYRPGTEQKLEVLRQLRCLPPAYRIKGGRRGTGDTLPRQNDKGAFVFILPNQTEPCLSLRPVGTFFRLEPGSVRSKYLLRAPSKWACGGTLKTLSVIVSALDIRSFIHPPIHQSIHPLILHSIAAKLVAKEKPPWPIEGQTISLLHSHS